MVVNETKSGGFGQRSAPDNAMIKVLEDIEEEVEDLRPVLARVLPADWDRPMTTHDQAALDATVERAWRIVFRHVSANVRSRTEAEELTQEVFCRVLSRLGKWESNESLRKAYLVQAARNLLRDQWRAKGRSAEAEVQFNEDRSASPDGPEDEVMRRIEGKELRAALELLQPVQREVLRLRILEAQSADETAAAIGKSPEAVRQIQHRALLALRTELLRAAAEDD